MSKEATKQEPVESTPEEQVPQGEGDLSPFQQFIKTASESPESEPAPKEEPEKTDEGDEGQERQDPNATIQDLVKQHAKKAPDENTQYHEFFEDLAKPRKGANTAEQIEYVKEVGRRWEQHAKELEGKVKDFEGKKYDPTETEEWRQVQEELGKYKTEAEKKKELEHQLASIDLQFDPIFIKDIHEPIQQEEHSLVEVIKASKGEDSAELIPAVQAALGAQSEAEFLNNCKKITDEVGGAFGLAAFDHLRKIRSLNKKKEEYLKDHQATAKEFLTRRYNENRANGSKFLESDWKKYRSEAEKSVDSTWKYLERDGFGDLLDHAKKAKGSAVDWAQQSLQSNIEQFGGVTDSVAQTMALAPELLSLIPMINKALEYIGTKNDEYSKLRGEYEKLTKGTSTSAKQTRQDQIQEVSSLADFAKKQGMI